ncbi:MAG: glycosyltransferase [Phycisphaerales bacterium]|nr:glycosyltransferase [Phycisphaerales bacterium]
MLRDLAVGLKGYGRGGGEFLPAVVSLKTLPPTGQGVVEELKAADVEVWSLELGSVMQLVHGVQQLRKVIQTFAPEVVISILVHANALTTFAMMLPPRSPARLVQSIHTLQEKPAWHWTLTRFIARYADALVVPSQTILDKIRQKQTKVLQNGIDVMRFAEAKGFEKLPWPAGAKVVGYVGRFDRVKNLPLLLRGFSRMAKKNENNITHLALVGYGPEEKRLKKMAAELRIQDRVHFPGPTQEPERWYKSFACHCLPSTSEGFGLTLAESIAAGVPVVAVRMPVTEAIVRHGLDGLLIDRPDENLLAEALQKVTHENKSPPLSPTLTPKSTETACEYVRQHFSVEHMVEQYAKFLKNFRR